LVVVVVLQTTTVVTTLLVDLTMDKPLVLVVDVLVVAEMLHLTEAQMVNTVEVVEVQVHLVKDLRAELVLVLGTQVLVEVLEVQDALTRLLVV
jgi:hypothetical protein